MDSDLEQIVGQAGEVDLDSGHVEVHPLRMREIPPFARALRPVLPQLGHALASGMDADAIVALLEDGEHLLDAVAIAVRKPRDWVDNLEPDAFAILALKVLEVNADFFARRLMPVMAIKLAQATAALGGTQASGSSTTATATG